MITKVKEKLEATAYTGSPHTFEDVQKQLRERLGDEVADSYDATQNVRTFKSWISAGFVPVKGSKSFSSVVMIEKRDKKNKVISKYAKRIALFHISQVKKVE